MTRSRLRTQRNNQFDRIRANDFETYARIPSPTSRYIQTNAAGSHFLQPVNDCGWLLNGAESGPGTVVSER